MNTIYGESPEIRVEDGYAANGGVSLFSTRSAGETITSSDQSGEQIVGGRILWWITDIGDGSYAGGITGSGWCREDYPYDNPFKNYTDAQIWDEAEQSRNLNKIFAEFNDIWLFASHVANTHSACMSGTPY